MNVTPTLPKGALAALGRPGGGSIRPARCFKRAP